MIRDDQLTNTSVASQIFFRRYFLNLVLVDEEDRRYFKQQEARMINDPRVLRFKDVLLQRFVSTDTFCLN